MSSNSKDANCDNCGKLVKNSNKHMKKHKQTNKCLKFNQSTDLSCVCDVCGKLVSNKKRLSSHKQSNSCKNNKLDTEFLELKRKQLLWFEKIQKIKLIDWDAYETYEYGINDGKIYTKNRFEIGRYELWEDLENIIDAKYKDKDNYVVATNGGDRLYKFIVDKQVQVFQIKCGIYSQYRYDYVNDNLIFTDAVRYV
jgi:hypothetical protein